MKHLFKHLAVLLIVLLSMGWESAAVASGGGAAASPPILAQAAEGAGLNWWYLLSQVVLSVVLIVVAFRPQPALHKQFADKEDTDKKLDGISTSLKSLDSKFDGWDIEQARRREALYYRLGAVENALSYMAGKLAREGDPDADRLRRILESGMKDAQQATHHGGKQ
jgi:hypothetical protein